jgi:AAA domain
VDQVTEQYDVPAEVTEQIIKDLAAKGVYDPSAALAMAKAGAWPASNGDGDAPQRRLLFTPASKITPRPVRWAWDTTPPGADPTEQGRFPAGSLVLAVGRAGLGKSQFAVWAASHITRGVLPGCHYGAPRSVVYCATEDSWEMTIVPRLLAAGADLDRVFHVRAVDDGDPHARLALPEDTGLLEAGIGEHDVVLVVLDPLLSLLDHEINDYRAREVRHALEPVVAVADRTRCLFLGLAHFNKATGSDPLMLVSGSGAFGQLIRAGVGFARDEETDDDSLVLSQIKNNLGREDLPSLKYEIQPVAVETPEGLSYVSKFRFTGEESERSVRDLLRGAGSEDPDAKSERDEAAKWLRDYLAGCGGEAPRKDLLKAAKAEGFSEATLKRAARKAGVRSVRSGFQGGSVWTLQSHPDHHSGHSDHTSECELNGPNESRMGSAEPPCKHVDQLPPYPPPESEIACVCCKRWVQSLGSDYCEHCKAKDDSASGQHAYVCDRCGARRTAILDMAGLPHPDCGGRFQPAGETIR